MTALSFDDPLPGMVPPENFDRHLSFLVRVCDVSTGKVGQLTDEDRRLIRSAVWDLSVVVKNPRPAGDPLTDSESSWSPLSVKPRGGSLLAMSKPTREALAQFIWSWSWLPLDKQTDFVLDFRTALARAGRSASVIEMRSQAMNILSAHFIFEMEAGRDPFPETLELPPLAVVGPSARRRSKPKRGTSDLPRILDGAELARWLGCQVSDLDQLKVGCLRLGRRRLYRLDKVLEAFDSE